MLDWNTIKSNALKFSKKYEKSTNENAEKQLFYIDFFEIFGINKDEFHNIINFEYPVTSISKTTKFIDVLWKGVILIEHKSVGKDLNKAFSQASEYIQYLNENERPKYILVSDFQTFILRNTSTNKQVSFPLKNLHKYIEYFSFISDISTLDKNFDYIEKEELNIHASELLGDLYDRMYKSHKDFRLDQFLVRILFCLFAENTDIFEKGQFKQYIEDTKEDGSDTGEKLSALFQILNTPADKRPKTISDKLNSFEYINGGLFQDITNIPFFDAQMRTSLLKCCDFDWSNISPAIFGSLFQCVSDKTKRRTLGEHYTSEENIFKVIKPLFLDSLWDEFNKTIKSNVDRFLEKLSNIRILDPACGCGNFLVVAYRELRRLELEALKLKYGTQQVMDIDLISNVNVGQFYGIEISDFPCKIAEVAMWLCDHQMNQELSDCFGKYYKRIPLRKSAKIVCGNAIRMDWNEVVSSSELTYIIGNPPFIGARKKNKDQADDMKKAFENAKGIGNLDYVCAWYKKATDYAAKTTIPIAFVSTNSITQGVQPAILWSTIGKDWYINFAYQTFIWNNEARGKAQVHCVILGISLTHKKENLLYTKDNQLYIVNSINYNLTNSKPVLVKEQPKQISNLLEMKTGNMPNEGGNLLFTEDEYLNFIEKEPISKKYFREFISGKDFLNGKKRYCLWLVDIDFNDIGKIPLIDKQIKAVKEYRLASTRPSTRKLSEKPREFAEIRQNDDDYIGIPRDSSGKRKYIPISFFNKMQIVGDSYTFIPNGTLFEFGILESLMHMTWASKIGGKIKSDYRYSVRPLYNTFPFPTNISKEQKENICLKAKKVLNIREQYKDWTLSKMYNPNYMPNDLLKAHAELDKAVDICYRKKTFESDDERLQFLFDMYEKRIAELKSS